MKKLFLILVLLSVGVSALKAQVYPNILSVGPLESSPAYYYINTKIPFTPAPAPQLQITGYNYGHSNKAVKLTLGWYIWENRFYWSQFISDAGYSRPSRIRLGTYDDSGVKRIRVEIANDGVYWSGFFISATDHNGELSNYQNWNYVLGEMPSGTGDIVTVSEPTLLQSTFPQKINFQHSLHSYTPGVGAYGMHLGGVTSKDYANGITFGAADATEGQAQAGIYVQSSGVYGTKMYFGTTDDYSVGSKTRMLIDDHGNVGLGTITPATRLQVNYERPINSTSIGTGPYGLHIGGVTTADHANGITFGAAGTADGQAHAGIYVQSSGTYGTKMYFGTTDDYSVGSKPRMMINHAGDVGIGTSQPDAKLTVKGKIHAEEVKVDLNVPGPDYVFEKDYQLTSLAELEKYVNANKHLPEIPSAQTMEKEGISMGEMQMKLLQKVEELTLYMIEKDKQIDALKQDLKAQSAELIKQRAELQKLNRKIK